MTYSGIWTRNQHYQAVSRNKWVGMGLEPPLYAFTSFTFTTAGITGQNGPTLSNCLSSYNTSTYPWLLDTGFFNVVTQGIQQWTIPSDGWYRVLGYGGQGGDSRLIDNSAATIGGYSVSLQGDFYLQKGRIVKIVIGHRGDTNTANPTARGGGGGGATWVVATAFTGGFADTALIIAGGGGGAGNYAKTTNCDAVLIGTSNPGLGPAGTFGAGASPSYGGAGGWYASGGGGWGAAGSPGTQGHTTGGAYLWGGTNIGGNLFSDGANGGFGGGGGCYAGAGGGGGYAGGGGGGWSYSGEGGGGSSYNAGANQSNGTGHTGAGSLTITKL